MTIEFFASADDAGGAIGTQIASGALNALFKEVTAPELLAGVEEYRKIWLKTDEDKEVYSFMLNDGLYDVAVFESANPDTDVVGDLTGAERKHSPALVTASTTTSVTVSYDDTMQSYVLDDIIRIDALYNVVDSFLDNGDGTGTITVRNTIDSPATYIGTYLTTMINKVYTNNVASAFWIKLKIASGSNYISDTDNLPLRNVY